MRKMRASSLLEIARVSLIKKKFNLELGTRYVRDILNLGTAMQSWPFSEWSTKAKPIRFVDLQ